jgi:hypothetical protein
VSDLAAVGLIAFLWVALFLAACVHDLRVNGRWPDLPWPKRILYTIRDTGDPQRYVHMFYGECRRPWCDCHSEVGEAR